MRFGGDAEMSRFFSFLFFCLFFFISEGREVLLPQTPVSTYEDTESSVSVQLPVLKENDRKFSLSLSLMATASNHLEVAFGLDKNRDGDLSFELYKCGKVDCLIVSRDNHIKEYERRVVK